MALSGRHLARVGACMAALVLAPAAAQAAASVTADSTAQVLEEIQFAVLLDMDFGKIAVRDNALGGVVTIDPASGSRNCNANLVCTGSFAVSRLLLTGSDANVQVNFDSTFTLTGPGDPIQAVPQFPGGPGAVVRLTGGSTVVKFGAAITINPGQAPGKYNGTFTVNLEYN